MESSVYFMVPKDISYSNKKGKLNLYASSETKEAGLSSILS